jgi:predicted GH43/DUF377 family glycosyl hydrolase
VSTQLPIPVTRLPHHINPDPSRVIPRFFSFGDAARMRRTIERVLALKAAHADAMLTSLENEFRNQNPDIADVWREHYERVEEFMPDGAAPDERRRLLIGAYFTMEYAIESAALFNPSMVPAGDQSRIPEGATRFIMSLRATGEGHVSSIVFRRGIIDADNRVWIETAGSRTRLLRVADNRKFDKSAYVDRVTSAHGTPLWARLLLDHLADEFTIHEFTDVIERLRQVMGHDPVFEDEVENLLSLARANYDLEVPDDVDPTELVIFPFSENESRGIEDVRLCRFVDDDGTVTYYGTYTAFNGQTIVPQLLEFAPRGDRIRVRTIVGRSARNKGMALFPRPINGRYVMSARLDGENLFIMRSDHVRKWEDAQLVQTPRFPWEFVQIGNCGCPLETDAGWLLLTHGVGPMRRYCIGVSLLDRDDPTKIVGQLDQPLLAPSGAERTGYVPNVVYSCGGMIHNDALIIPYAMSDFATGFAMAPLDAILERLTK